MIIGYARVSTAEQDLAAQIEALTKAGCTKIYREKVSGAKSDRVELTSMLQFLTAGDVLIVTRLDRLARSTLDLLGILKRVTDVAATFKSLADTWADTNSPHGKLMVTILGGLAEFERTLILARTGEGRKRALAAGVKFGAKRKLSSQQQEEARARLTAGESPGKISKDFNVARSTIQRLGNEDKPNRAQAV